MTRAKECLDARDLAVGKGNSRHHRCALCRHVGEAGPSAAKVATLPVCFCQRRTLMQLVMEEEVKSRAGERHEQTGERRAHRWGSEAG